MDYFNRLKILINENKGFISTKMVSDAGIPRMYLSDLVKKDILKRIERGIYISADSSEDKMYCFQMRYEQSIYSHESALILHKILEKSHHQYTVTVKTGVNTKSLIKSGAKVYSIKKELYPLGLTTINTDYGRSVKVYNIERCICDIIRSRSQIDPEIISKTLKEYNNNSKKDLQKLIVYAEKLKVLKILLTYMEFL